MNLCAWDEENWLFESEITLKEHTYRKSPPHNTVSFLSHWPIILGVLETGIKNYP